MLLLMRALKKNKLIYELGRKVKADFKLANDKLQRTRMIKKRKQIIADYLRDNQVPKLHIGSGPMVLEGWLNTDLRPRQEKNIIHLDITEKMPFEDNSCQYIYSEHLIEHIKLDDAVEHLKDCYRILKKGGVIRISTPDLSFLLRYFSQDAMSDIQYNYLKKIIDQNHGDIGIYHPTILLNRFLRDWGHQFIYDKDVLTHLLEKIGFEKLMVCRVMESEEADLQGLEQHGTAISED